MTAIAPAPKKSPRKSRGAVLTPEQLAATTCVFEVRLSSPSFRRSLRTQDVLDGDTSTDPTMLHMRKDLIDPDALSALAGRRAKYVRWLQGRTISCSMLAPGMSLVPLALVKEVDEGTTAFIKDRAKLVDDVLKRYSALKKDAKKRLGKHYNEADYPTEAEVRAAFTVTRKFLSYNVPAAFENLNKDLYAREMARVQAECVEASAEIRAALREAFAGLVEHLAEKLTPGDDDKPKTFRDTTVTKLTDFLSTFAARNLTGDAELSSLAQQAKSVLDGVNPDDLRKQEDVRERVLKGVSAIKDRLAKMDVVNKKARRVADDGEV